MSVRQRIAKTASRQPRVLSVQRCRDILGPTLAKSDAEIEQLRDELYAIAGTWIDGGAKAFSLPLAENVASLSEEDRAEVEERAAIMEIDGGLTRSEAERVALAAFIRKQKGVH